MKKPLIVIAGPTACGKTDISIDLAEKIGGEIISGDSMQVYKNIFDLLDLFQVLIGKTAISLLILIFNLYTFK